MSISKNKLKEMKDHFRKVVKVGNDFADLVDISESAYADYEEELVVLAEEGDIELQEISEQIQKLEDRLFP